MNKISENKIKELITELKKLSSLKESKRKINYWYQQKQNIVNSETVSTDLIKEFLDEYNRVKKSSCKTESVETDDRAVTNIERDEEGLIQYYTFEIFRKDAPTLTGKLDRKEMETIYRLYSIYGANLTQKIVSREFPEFTFVEFKRILRAFNIYKANSEFAPHIIEERSEDELINLHNQNKENSVLRRIEKDQLTEANKLINKLAKENLELKSINYNDFHFTIDNEVEKVPVYHKTDNQSILVLHLSDLHIGACLESGSLFENEWNEEELQRRLDKICELIGENFGEVNEIIVNMLGDYLDGMDRMTSRRDHFMPQNMDNKTQFNVFIRQMLRFFTNLYNYCNCITVYAVPEGNHDGYNGYFAIKALQYACDAKFEGIDFYVSDRFFFTYKIYEGKDRIAHTYCIMHGKDAKFMKKPLPLNLTSTASDLLRDWLDKEGMYEENIHIIKGDLHSDNLNSCRKFDYRNVLSLFGESDYSQYNYPSNGYGISYDLITGNNRMIGTFKNF